MLSRFISTSDLDPDSINAFLSSLDCRNGKNAYYRAIRAFCNWLYRQGHLKDNPISKVDPPKMVKVILPSLTPEQVTYLIEQAESIRDKAIISLFADSGMRLSELLSIRESHIDWGEQTVLIWGKGGKQRKAPFTNRSYKLLKQVVSQNGRGDNIWHIEPHGIQLMLQRLGQQTGLPCNPHTFRRTFASNLHRAGMDIEHIMRLGGWSSLDMVLTYTKSVKFEDSLKIYKSIKSK